MEREQLQRAYEAKLKERDELVAAATEGKEALARRLDAEVEVGGVGMDGWWWKCVFRWAYATITARPTDLSSQEKVTAIAALDAQLQVEQQIREATQARVASPPVPPAVRCLLYVFGCVWVRCVVSCIMQSKHIKAKCTLPPRPSK